jgi:hypothetical protein
MGVMTELMELHTIESEVRTTDPEANRMEELGVNIKEQFIWQPISIKLSNIGLFYASSQHPGQTVVETKFNGQAWLNEEYEVFKSRYDHEIKRIKRLAGKESLLP